MVLECVVNISEGCDQLVLDEIAASAGDALLDIHKDRHHNRAVLTLVGEDAPRAVASAAVVALDLGVHEGAHPRMGVVDVVPFVALQGSEAEDAVRARNDFSAWFARQHEVPCFRYGAERSLPEVRREAFTSLRPDDGPASPHPSAGATAVGARPVLVAYNVWVSGVDLPTARQVAAAVRGPGVRALGLAVGDRLQVSMNLVEPDLVDPAIAFDAVAENVALAHGSVDGAELVGLLPQSVLHAVDPGRWAELDLAPERTIEARLR